MGNEYHTSVLLQETVDALNVRPGKRYIDATLGGGGHTDLILKRGGIVLGIDADQDALDYVQGNQKSKIKDQKLILVKGNFKDIDKIARDFGFENLDGILFDLGVSSHQLDTPERGFSFQSGGPLDMRMDQDLGVKAADLINILTKNELIELFLKLGEEYKARNIAQRIIEARKLSPITTTLELVEIVRGEMRGNSKINPATKVFQALRIAINDELNALSIGLPKAFSLLGSGARLAVISFHSLEDRIVKRQFKEYEDKGQARLVNKKPIIPTPEEIRGNRRSRSSKLRIIEKI